jgi:hypothetical protein
MCAMLQTALILFGTGLLFFSCMGLFRWGPCGPSSIWALIFLLVSMVCFGVGSLLAIAVMLKKLFSAVRATHQA